MTDFSMMSVFRDAGVRTENLKPIEQSLRTLKARVGEHLIIQGENAPELFFITKGLAKMYYITIDGKEFVKSFLPEGSFAGSLMAQVEGQPSTFSVVCLEPLEAQAVPFVRVQALFEQDPAAAQFGMGFFRALALKKERREYSFLCLSPQERYRWFVEENPELASRLTQADIARYLGITPVALSRIRGRIVRTK